MKKIILTILGFAAITIAASAQTYSKTTASDEKTSNTVANGNETTSSSTEKTQTATETELDNTVIVNQFSKNWELGIGIGTQAYLGEYSHTHFKFKDWWTGPAFDVTMQKWASPFFGLGFGLNFSPYTGLYHAYDPTKGDDQEALKATFAKLDKDPDYECRGNRGIMKQAGKDLSSWYGNFFIFANFDITNILGGYRRDRFYHLIGYIGGGVAVPFVNGKYRSTTASFNAGLTNQFTINDNWLINLAVRGAIYGDALNGINYWTSGDKKNIPVDGMIGLTVGAAYKFGFVKKKSVLTGEETTAAWIPMTTAIIASKEYAEVVHEAKEQEAKAQEAEKKVEVTEQKLATVEKVVEEQNKTLDQIKEGKVLAVQDGKIVARQPVKYRQLVNFVIDRWEISNREKVAIMLAAEIMKALPDTKFSVNGYADMQTSYPEHNKMLSENRAAAVKKVLVEEFGIPESQLIVNDYGGVDYMFYFDPQCSRSVIIEALL